MQRSERRILTTHVGSLPRNATLRDLLVRQERGEAIDEAALARDVEAAVRTVVRRQLEVGIDVGNDGEQPRVGFSTYVARRMRGFGGESRRPLSRDLLDFPDYAAMLALRRQNAARIMNAPQAVAAVEYADLGEAARECDLFLRATDAEPRQFVERFMTAASPGIIATTMLNAHYDSHERYVRALAAEMRKEYELIHARGLLLQVDCPDLAMERPRLFQHESLARFLEIVEVHIDALNGALAGIPRDRIRLHVCWGNYDGPHTHDVPLEAILPALYQARVGALSLELANPRHAHEYKVLKHTPPPDGMLLLPGVIDSTTNFVEHPEVVADRICQAADAVGDPGRVIASVDCGFGTFAGSEMVAESVVWAKLAALREGAAIASARLWGRGSA
ncbi:MAG: cobalamin-independent methionine synthase II family protein [Candidatus Rokubacteria bacterium]|nr:cobalamin-independent methionine synthase II family protein [Candidatus Rokubacteria bacterium]